MEKNFKHTNWTEATTNFYDAFAGLLSCLKAGKNCWVEVQQNGEQDYPVIEKNKALDNPFNWTMSYGVPAGDHFKDHNFFNETQKDLTENWTACFATAEAAKLYEEKGKATAGLLAGCGVCIPVRHKDADKLRKDGYKYGAWVYAWKPKDGVPYHIPKKIGKVFVVCYDDKPADDKNSLKSFLTLLQGLLAKGGKP